MKHLIDGIASRLATEFQHGLVITVTTALAFFAISSTARAGDLKEVRLGYFPNLTHAQAVLGVASGDFEKAVAPVKFTTKTFNAGPSAIEAIFAGEIDVQYIGPSPALNGFAKSRGEGVRVISGAAANGVLIVAGANSGINSLADLKGKRVATPQLANTQDVAARHYLRTKMGQENLDNVLPVPNAEQSALLSRGQIDASWAVEPWASRLVAEAGGRIIGREEELWPQGQFSTTIIITTPKFLNEHPEVIEKLLKVHMDWTKQLQDKPDESVAKLEEALFTLTNKKLPPGVGIAAFKNIVFTNDPLAFTFDVFSQWSFDLGFSKTKTNVSKLVDTTILDRLRASK